MKNTLLIAINELFHQLEINNFNSKDLNLTNTSRKFKTLFDYYVKESDSKKKYNKFIELKSKLNNYILKYGDMKLNKNEFISTLQNNNKLTSNQINIIKLRIKSNDLIKNLICLIGSYETLVKNVKVTKNVKNIKVVKPDNKLLIEVENAIINRKKSIYEGKLDYILNFREQIIIDKIIELQNIINNKINDKEKIKTYIVYLYSIENDLAIIDNKTQFENDLTSVLEKYNPIDILNTVDKKFNFKNEVIEEINNNMFLKINSDLSTGINPNQTHRFSFSPYIEKNAKAMNYYEKLVSNRTKLMSIDNIIELYRIYSNNLKIDDYYDRPYILILQRIFSSAILNNKEYNPIIKNNKDILALSLEKYAICKKYFKEDPALEFETNFNDFIDLSIKDTTEANKLKGMLK